MNANVSNPLIAASPRTALQDLIGILSSANVPSIRNVLRKRLVLRVMSSMMISALVSETASKSGSVLLATYGTISLENA